MDKIWHNLKLDLSQGGSQDALYVREDDTGTHMLNILLRSGGRAYQLTDDVVATIRGTRPDGTVIYNECYIADNCVRVELTTSMLSVMGTTECVLQLVGTEPAVLTTPGFDIIVEHVDDTAGIEGTSEFSSLVKQTAETKALQMEIETKLENGEFDGYSPEVTVTPIEDGYRLDVKNKDTEYSVNIIAPEKGETGNGIASAVLNADYTLTLHFTDGSKYTTPSIRGEQGNAGVSATHSWNGTVLTVTSASGTSSADLKGGKGDDGISPILSATQIAGGHRVSMQDKDGTKTFDVMDGKDGDNGVTPAFSIGTVTTLAAGQKATASIGGTAANPVLNLGIPKGADGKDGEDAEGGGGTSDHAQLTNRDAADQHPISAISGLQDALDDKQPKGNYITEVPSEYVTKNELAGKGYLTEETDPTVPSWAKAKDKPTYTAAEVNALPADTKIPSKLSEMEGDTTHRVVTDAEKAAWNAKSEFSGKYADLEGKPNIPTVPVQSVNGKTGAVVLDAEDVGARPDTWIPTAAQVGADSTGTATSAVSGHNANKDSHPDLRLEVSQIKQQLTEFLDIDNETLDQLSELIAAIVENRTDIAELTSGKLNKTDVINNLTTNSSDKALSAAQGVVIKALIDAIKVPTRVSELSNDANYAKKSELPTVPTNVSAFTNDSGYLTAVPSEYVTETELAAKKYLTSVPSEYVTETELAAKKYLTSYTETDPTVPSWAKAASKPSYTASEVGAVPTTRTVNNKALSANITLSASDVSAVPTSRTVNGKALSSNITLSASDVSAVSTSSSLTVTGIDADGTTHTWTMYGVKQ